MTKDVEKRWANNGKLYSKCPHFWNAILKYSWDFFEHTVLKDNLTKKEAQGLEKELIKKYQTQNSDYGYNIAEGGTGGITYIEGQHPLSKKVYQYDLKGNYLREWNDAHEVHKELGISPNSIHCAARLERSKAGDYLWRYEKFDVIDLPTSRRTLKTAWTYKPILKIDNEFNIVQRFNNAFEITSKRTNGYEKAVACCRRQRLRYDKHYWCFEEDFGDEFIQYINSRLKTKQRPSKKVNQYDKFMNLIGQYDSAKDVMNKTGIKDYLIRFSCSGTYKDHGLNSTGYYWYYVEDLKEGESNGQEI